MEFPYELAVFQGEDDLTARLTIDSITHEEGGTPRELGALLIWEGVLNGEMRTLVSWEDLGTWRATVESLRRGEPTSWRKSERALAINFSRGDWGEWWLHIEHPTFPYINIGFGLAAESSGNDWLEGLLSRVDELTRA